MMLMLAKAINKAISEKLSSGPQDGKVLLLTNTTSVYMRNCRNLYEELTLWLDTKSSSVSVGLVRTFSSTYSKCKAET